MDQESKMISSIARDTSDIPDIKSFRLESARRRCNSYSAFIGSDSYSVVVPTIEVIKPVELEEVDTPRSTRWEDLDDDFSFLSYLKSEDDQVQDHSVDSVKDDSVKDVPVKEVAKIVIGTSSKERTLKSGVTSQPKKEPVSGTVHSLPKRVMNQSKSKKRRKPSKKQRRLKREERKQAISTARAKTLDTNEALETKHAALVEDKEPLSKRAWKRAKYSVNCSLRENALANSTSGPKIPVDEIGLVATEIDVEVDEIGVESLEKQDEVVVLQDQIGLSKRAEKYQRNKANRGFKATQKLKGEPMDDLHFAPISKETIEVTTQSNRIIFDFQFLCRYLEIGVILLSVITFLLVCYFKRPKTSYIV